MDDDPGCMSPNPTSSEVESAIPEHAVAVMAWSPGGSDACPDRLRHRKIAHGTIVAIVRNGSYTVARNGRMAVTMNRGQAFLAQDGDQLDITHHSAADGTLMSAHWVHFRVVLFGAIDACALLDLPDMLDARQAAGLARLIDDTRVTAPGLTGAMRRVEAGLTAFRLLAEAAPLSAAGQQMMHGDPGLRALGPWVMARLQQPITIADLVRATGYSRSRLHARFQAEFACAPLTWVREQRLLAARDRLFGTTDGVAEIGLRCGFADAFHFSRAMRVRFGMSPSGLRRAGGLAP